MRGHVHGDEGRGPALRGRHRQVRARRVPLPAGGPARPRDLRAARRLRLRQPRPGDAPDPGRALEAGRPAHVLLRGPRGVRRHHRHDHADRRAAGDPPLLGRPHLRPDPGSRDGVLHPVGADGGDRGGPARHPQRGHPLPDHPVHGVRGQAAPALHGGEQALGRRGGQDQPDQPRPRGGGLQALLLGPGAGLPDRGLVRGHAGRAQHRGVLHQPHEGHHRDDELLRALPAGRGARVQRPRQGGGGLRLRRQVLRLRGALDRDPPARGQGGPGQAPDARSRTRRRGCPASSSSARRS